MRMPELWSDESGASLVEYSLLLALIAIACVGSITGFKDGLGQLFNSGTEAFPTAS